MSDHVSDDEVRQMLQHLAGTTQNSQVRRVMLRATQLLDGEGLAPAAASLLDEMAKTKRAERAVLWLGPLAALATAAVVFAMLKGFWLAI